MVILRVANITVDERISVVPTAVERSTEGIDLVVRPNRAETLICIVVTKRSAKEQSFRYVAIHPNGDTGCSQVVTAVRSDIVTIKPIADDCSPAIP